MGLWSRDGQKTLGGLLLAVAFWATDCLHHIHPAVLALGIALLLALPQVGVPDVKAIKAVNFLLIMCISGALSIGNVLLMLVEGVILMVLPCIGRLLAYPGGVRPRCQHAHLNILGRAGAYDASLSWCRVWWRFRHIRVVWSAVLLAMCLMMARAEEYGCIVYNQREHGDILRKIAHCLFGYAGRPARVEMEIGGTW